MIKDWNRERRRTRDRLLDYDFSIVPPLPHSAGLAMVYPWEQTAIASLSHQIYEIAKFYGFSGTEQEFFTKFGSNGECIYRGRLEDFPIPGLKNNLYLDEETEILYYFKETTETVLTDIAAKAGAQIVGQSVTDTNEVITYLYIPVRALPIENLIYDCGDAAEYID